MRVARPAPVPEGWVASSPVVSPGGASPSPGGAARGKFRGTSDAFQRVISVRVRDTTTYTGVTWTGGCSPNFNGKFTVHIGYNNQWIASEVVMLARAFSVHSGARAP